MRIQTIVNILEILETVVAISINEAPLTDLQRYSINLYLINWKISSCFSFKKSLIMTTVSVADNSQITKK